MYTPPLRYITHTSFPITKVTTLLIFTTRLQAQILANYRPTIPVRNLIPELKQREMDIAKTISYFNRSRHLVLYYEDLIRNQTVRKYSNYSTMSITFFNLLIFATDIFRASIKTQKLTDVQNFLKLPYRDLKSRQVKIHTGPLSKHVSNWEEIRKTLNGTSYEKFLYSR